MSSSAARSADRGGGAERRRGWEIGEVVDFTALRNCREAALLLWVKNPLGPLDHSPYLAAVAATQGETLQRFPAFGFQLLFLAGKPLRGCE